MPANWNFILPTASSDLHFGDGTKLAVVRRKGARGMRLAVDPRSGAVRLTLAPRAPLAAALAWAETKRAWVEDQLVRVPQPLPVVPAMAFRLGDEQVRLDWAHDHPRTPRLVRDGAVALLRVGGARDSLNMRVVRWLRGEALRVLERETRELAARHTVTVGRVGIGDPRGRWGSCGCGGDIRYSWRLILAPGFVRRSVVAHEVAHRLHMDHSPRFHAAHARLLGEDPTPARAWLKANGNALHAFGATGGSGPTI